MEAKIVPLGTLLQPRTKYTRYPVCPPNPGSSALPPGPPVPTGLSREPDGGRIEVAENQGGSPREIERPEKRIGRPCTAAGAKGDPS